MRSFSRAFRSLLHLILQLKLREANAVRYTPIAISVFLCRLKFFLLHKSIIKIVNRRMDSGTIGQMSNGIKDHLSLQANGSESTAVPFKQPFVIGVAGGTASGKTTVCKMIISQLHDQRVVLVHQDSFYRSLSDGVLKKVGEYNFDHPDAFDTELMLLCMEKLKHGQAITIPNYDFKTHKSLEIGRKVNPSDVIILEGILILHDPRVRDLMNMKIFVDEDSDVRLARRIKRDTVERGRNIQNVLDQYGRFVKPSFDEFILPSKKYADIIIPRGGDNHVAIDLIVQHIRTKLGQHDLCKIYPNIFVILSTFQIRGMHTLVRDAKTTKHDFVFYADRLIRLVVEHGLGHLPFTEKQIITPTGSVYTGVVFCRRLCGVSVIRSGESMENALRACCKGIKIGKILIHGEGNNGRQLIYEKLPADISSRHVLLLDPVLASGNSAVKAISLLLSKGVPESNIIFLNLIAAPQGIHAVCEKFPKLKIVTSEIDASLDENLHVIPGMGEFADRYFGTNSDAATCKH
ncbi:uridine kinase-like protein 5 isoform X2 [Tripterygium wilfordii]|uniref:uridine kinase-like protein 5 isoform X2 n=1 Tax=Tripterygium wilfordii TaxID=458696 RepID=UPI0018F85F39|nr:uridine kinase-like protein 5 isoform X2 [Tripterygium wilfordii]